MASEPPHVPAPAAGGEVAPPPLPPQTAPQPASSGDRELPDHGVNIGGLAFSFAPLSTHQGSGDYVGDDYYDYDEDDGATDRDFDIMCLDFGDVAANTGAHALFLACQPTPFHMLCARACVCAWLYIALRNPQTSPNVSQRCNHARVVDMLPLPQTKPRLPAGNNHRLAPSQPPAALRRSMAGVPHTKRRQSKRCSRASPVWRAASTWGRCPVRQLPHPMPPSPAR